MNKMIGNFPVTLLYILHVVFFTIVAIIILASMTLTGILDLPNVWITAEEIFIAEQKSITAILSSGLLIALIFDAGIYAGRWLDNNEEAFHVKFKIMMCEYLKKIIEEQKKEERHDNK